MTCLNIRVTISDSCKSKSYSCHD